MANSKKLGVSNQFYYQRTQMRKIGDVGTQSVKIGNLKIARHVSNTCPLTTHYLCDLSVKKTATTLSAPPLSPPPYHWVVVDDSGGPPPLFSLESKPPKRARKGWVRGLVAE